MNVPIPVTGGLLVALLLFLGIAFWRSARNLQGHSRAGAEAIVSALARQMEPSRPYWSSWGGRSQWSCR